MAEIKGYAGAFYVTSDVTSTSDVTNEAVGTGTGLVSSFDLDNENVDPDTLSVTVAAVAQQWGQDYNMTPKGALSFTTVVASDAAIVASYTYWKGAFIEAGGFHAWSVDVSCDPLETTNFSSTGWREYIGGLKSWTGSAERHWINNLQALAGKKAVVRFYYDETNSDYLTGWANITGISTTAAVETLVEESLSFQGTLLIEDADVL